MKQIIRLLMVLLSYAPFESVAVAAYSKANELDAEIKAFNIRQQLSEARFRLLQSNTYGNTMEDAKARYALLTGLQGEALEKAMADDLMLLKRSGIINFNEKMIVAGGPSEHMGPF